jgi:hypothetical protein
MQNAVKAAEAKKSIAAFSAAMDPQSVRLERVSQRSFRIWR